MGAVTPTRCQTRDPSTLSATYAPPTPPPSTGPHRYLLIVLPPVGACYHSQTRPLYVERPNDSRRAKWVLVDWEQAAEDADVVVEVVAGSYFLVESGVDGDEASELSIKQDYL